MAEVGGDHEGVQGVEADTAAAETAKQFVNIDVASFLSRRTTEQKKFIASRFVVGLSTEEKAALRDLLTGELSKAAEVAASEESHDGEAGDQAVVEAKPVHADDAKGYNDAEGVDAFLGTINPEQAKELAAQIVAGLNVEDKTTLRDYLAEEVTKAETAVSDEQQTLAHEAAIGEGVGQTEVVAPAAEGELQAKDENGDGHEVASSESHADSADDETPVDGIIVVETFAVDVGPATNLEAGHGSDSHVEGDPALVHLPAVAEEDPHATREA